MAVATAREIVGRDEELALVSAFLADDSRWALVIEGDAGIGKTTLWRAAIDTASASGSVLMVARPTRAEAQLSLGSLADLLEGVSDDVVRTLPEIQRRAVAVVRSEEPANSNELDGRVLGFAFLNVLRELAASRPVVVAVDDVQWLDESSAFALVYAFRRLHGEPVRLVASCRGEPGAPLPFELDRLGESLQRLAVGPLSEGALHRLLHHRLGLSLPRRLLHALRETCGGNPFFALELGRAGIEPAEDGSIQLPRSLQALVRGRVAQLPAETRRALLYVAALSDPTLEVLGRCEAAEALDPAFAAGVIALERGRVRFDHPLLAAAVWDAAGPAQRRKVHGALAQASDNPEEQARHLALATDKPDAAVAEVLERAAKRARGRGATAAAAELLEQALRVTPADDERWARLAEDAIAAHREMGDRQRPLALVQEALERLPAGPVRASVLAAACEERPGSLDLARQAVEESGDGAIHVRALLALAEQHEHLGDWTGSLTAVRDAVDAAEHLGDRRLLGIALTQLGGYRLQAEDLGGRADLARAEEIEREVGPLVVGPSWTLSTTLTSASVWCDDGHEQVRPAVEARLRELAEQGDDEQYINVAANVIGLDQDAGRFDRARVLADECIRLDRSFDHPYSWLGHVLGCIAALEGDLPGARERMADAMRRYAEIGDRFGESQCHAWMTLIELCDGDYEAVLEHAALRHAFIGENLEVARLPHIEMNELEALVLGGHEARALQLIERLDIVAREQSRPRYAATADWGRGLLLAARGDLAGAQAALEDALRAHEGTSFPVERARIRLSYGQVLRRGKQRRSARAALNEAVAEFEQLGARHFANKAREELARVGGRTPAGEGELTPTEQKIARLVAEGRSNKQVAAQLFVTVRTVEATLTRVYAKLGVDSRLELSHLLEARAATNEAPPLGPRRILATVLFTDIVGSTKRARDLGDSRWTDLLERHHAVVRRELARFHGREIDTAGDGFFASFERPAQAIRCACAIRTAVQGLGLELRSGLHSGECELVGDKLAGIAINTGARVAAKASPGEVLVSRTVKDLVAGSGFEFAQRGSHELKGLSGQWELYALERLP